MGFSLPLDVTLFEFVQLKAQTNQVKFLLKLTLDIWQVRQYLKGPSGLDLVPNNSVRITNISLPERFAARM